MIFTLVGSLRLANDLDMIIFILLMGALYAALLYWLLPVAPQSMISADTISLVWSQTRFESLHSELINSLWRNTVLLWHLISGETDLALLYPTIAALHAWFIVASVMLVLWRVMGASGVRDKGFTLLLAGCLLPAFLWSAVVPTGFSFAIVAMTVGWFLRFESRSSAKLVARFFEGIAIGLSAAGLIPVLYRAVMGRASDVRSALDKSMIAMLIGFALVIVLSVGVWPAYSAVVGLRYEDQLGAGVVLLGGGGELRLALVGAVAWAFMLCAQTALIDSRRTILSISAAATGSIVLFSLLLQFGLFATRVEAWKLAHPGWNSILADAARNIEDGHEQNIEAYLPTPTEWSLSKYVQMQRGEKSKVNPRFMALDDKAVQRLLKDKKSLWFARLPNLNRGARIDFLGYGFLVSSLTNELDPTQFGFGGLRGVMVRSHLELSEVVAPKPLEVSVFERYAIIHMALARKYYKQKQPIDWERRAYLEQFAALRKVPWMEDPYRAVCIEHRPGEEPEDFCSKVKPYHDRRGTVPVPALAPDVSAAPWTDKK